ncbi:MAG: alkaline phosphatase family protein, partial [Gemmatimonadales bacterium]
RASLSHLRELHAELVDLTRRSAELAGWLLQRPWNLGIVVFGALHRGGHRFWDRSSVDGEVPPALGPWYDNALRELYRAADDAVGALIAAAPEATLFVFSLHGMQVNSARVDLLDDMLSRVLHGPAASRPKQGLLRRLGEAMPLGLRRALTNSVPQALKNRIMTRWTTGGVQWERTPAFTLRADLNGYIRLNLQGREPRGMVRPDEAGALSERISQGLQSFRDADSGEPLIEEVCRSRETFPAGDRSERLPDLIVRWRPTSGAGHRAVVSSSLGRVDRATPGRIPNGRSGNHAPRGFLMARGPDIAAGGRLEAGADILDLAPTVLRWLGAGTSLPLDGRVLTQLIRPSR